MIMTNSEIKIKNSFNLPSYTNTLYEIESNEDFLKVDYNKFDEFLIIGECTNLVLPTKLNKKVIQLLRFKHHRYLLFMRESILVYLI